MAAQSKTHTIVFIRHGESEWNEKNLFCGWYDADLSKKGMKEAENAGQTLKATGIKFDEAHTSVLKRANLTLTTILDTLGQADIPIYKTWRLNERHYGGLTGMNKSETAKMHGEEQVKIWRRSYDVPPPEITMENQYFNKIMKDPIFKDGPPKEEFPLTESLKSTIERTLPYWNETIVPKVKEGKTILIAAHGNSLRGLVKHLDKISDDKIVDLNIPTGIPFIYELDKNLTPVISMKFLGDEETVKKAMEAIAAQGKIEDPKGRKSLDSKLEEEAKKRKSVVDPKLDEVAKGTKTAEARSDEEEKGRKSVDAKIEEAVKVKKSTDAKIVDESKVSKGPDAKLDEIAKGIKAAEAKLDEEAKLKKATESKLDEGTKGRKSIEGKADEEPKGKKPIDSNADDRVAAIKEEAKSVIKEAEKVGSPTKAVSKGKVPPEKEKEDANTQEDNTSAIEKLEKKILKPAVAAGIIKETNTPSIKESKVDTLKKEKIATSEKEKKVLDKDL